MTYPLALLNTSIITASGSYELKPITLDEARDVFNKHKDNAGIDSAIGHESTATLFGTLMGSEVKAHRQQFAQQTGQHALVLKLMQRAPEGKILSIDEIEEIGYEFQLLSKTA
ncbi:STIV orfB116 family protein [Salinivibrio costicola]|uniref:STIV orfB116 family protein n=1 Tax=Salinivibrio costicola TaxID=51367 RepID=UPI00068771E1|nr:DUF1874 domain-containing protein [Salinivibrio costicola]